VTEVSLHLLYNIKSKYLFANPLSSTGSGVSPFLPVTTLSSQLARLGHAICFCLRLPLLLFYAGVYFLFLQYIPLPVVIRKLLLWIFLAIPAVWWVDVQLDGVRRGLLSQQPRTRVPHPGSVIAASFSSPLDALYLAAVFNPIFVASHPRSRKVRRISLLKAVCYALSADFQLADSIESQPGGSRGLTDLRALLSRYPNRIIVVFPESGTTNGRGVLPLSPCLLTTPAENAIFPISLRYTPPDVTTPVPGFRAWIRFLWNLLGRPTHCVRVRIAEPIYNTSRATNGGDWVNVPPPRAQQQQQQEGDGGPGNREEQALLDNVAEALARLGRAHRVNLTLRDKKAFVNVWVKR